MSNKPNDTAKFLTVTVVLLSFFSNCLFFFLVSYSGLYTPLQNVRYRLPVWEDENNVQFSAGNPYWKIYRFNVKTEEITQLKNGEYLDPFSQASEVYDELILDEWSTKLDLIEIDYYATSPAGKYVAVVGEPRKLPWEKLNGSNRLYIVETDTLVTQRISSIGVISATHLYILNEMGMNTVISVFAITVGINFLLLFFLLRKKLGILWIFLAATWIFVYFCACIWYLLSFLP
jgi:hypothetical protein